MKATTRTLLRVLRRRHGLLLALVLLVGAASGVAAQGGDAVPRRRPRTVDVGVILDRTTWVGNMSWTCMELAMEDFYADEDQAGYSARLRLHLRDPGPNAVDAAAAGTQTRALKIADHACIYPGLGIPLSSMANREKAYPLAPTIQLC